jgi:hypothetical protein
MHTMFFIISIGKELTSDSDIKNVDYTHKHYQINIIVYEEDCAYNMYYILIIFRIGIERVWGVWGFILLTISIPIY